MNRDALSHGLVRTSVAVFATLLCAVLALLPTPAGAAAASPASAAPAAHAPRSADVKVQVLSVTPSTPTPSHTKRPLTIKLKLTNTTARDLGTVSVSAVRGVPIENQRQLHQAIAHPSEPDGSLASPARPDPDRPVAAKLGPHAEAQITYRTTTNIPQNAGICLCHPQAIYPLYFRAVAADGTVLGSTQTYLPAFDVKPEPVRVSWIWPLVERPHRLRSPTQFTDDALAASVSGGRLDRMLQVVEEVGDQVPMTLVVDPDLIDELAVMAGGQYQVQQTGAGVVDGTGASEAQQWLARLRAVLDYPGTELYFTAPGDPDVQGLTRAGLDWSARLGPDARQRVREVLGGHGAQWTLSWPAGGVLRSQTLDALAAKGTQTVVVSDTSLAGRGRDDSGAARLSALGTLSSASGGVAAVTTSHYIQRYVGPVLSRGGAGLGALPRLVAQVAVHAVESPANSGYVAIAAPRDLDPDPAVAARAIRDTATAFWADALSVGTAVTTLQHSQHSRLAKRAPVQQLPSAVITAAQRVNDALPTLRSLFTSTSGADAVLDPLPEAIQRLESISWRSDPVGAATLATAVTATIESMSDGVHLVTPSQGSYTLASSTSPLPITVANELDFAVQVQVRVRTVNGLAGLTAEPTTEQVAPHSRVTVRVPTHVERSGRLEVVAELVTSGNVQLGPPVYLSVRSTALGTIGVIITAVAAVTLALALLVRLWLRLRRRRRQPPQEATSIPAALKSSS